MRLRRLSTTMVMSIPPGDRAVAATIARQQARDSLNLARLRPIPQLRETKSVIGRNNKFVNRYAGCLTDVVDEAYSVVRPMLRVTSSIGPLRPCLKNSC